MMISLKIFLDFLDFFSFDDDFSRNSWDSENDDFYPRGKSHWNHFSIFLDFFRF